MRQSTYQTHQPQIVWTQIRQWRIWSSQGLDLAQGEVFDRPYFGDANRGDIH
jgi:hypothetical protein